MNNLAKRKNFWKNKRVLITGHTGFKGVWLSLTLKLFGAKILGYSLAPPTSPSLFNIVKLKNIIFKSVISDIRNKNKLEKEIKLFKPEIIFHLAAQPLVIESYKDPYKTFETNSMGTLNILEVLRKYNKFKSALIITTDKVYDTKNDKRAYKESDPLGVTDPYGSSKYISEILTQSYSKSFFNEQNYLKVATARAGNVIGGGDFSENRLIPDYLRSLKRNCSLFIRNSNHIRPWQHVMEPIYGYIILSELIYKKKINKKDFAWNFAPNNSNSIKVRDLIDLINKLSFKKVKIQYSKEKIKFSETVILKLSNIKAKKKLDWKPIYNLHDTLNAILEWHKYYIYKKNIHLLIKKQINDFILKS